MDELKLINLADFGGDGYVEVGPQTLTMKVKLKNELGKRAKMKVIDGEQVLVYDDMGDVEIIKTLAFVRTAPFPITLKGFLDYCDTLDAIKVGNGEALLRALGDAAEEVSSSSGPLGN